MKLYANTGGVFATCSYLVVDEETKQAVLFDAPNDTTDPLLRIAAKHGYELVGLWLTHGHIDHIADHAVVTGRFPGAKALIHPLDEPKLRMPRSIYPLPFETAGRPADGHVADGQTLRIGASDVHVIHTPGHSPGHVAYHIPALNAVVGGDLILMGAVGRTDFPDSSFADLQASLRRVMRLPPETRLLPGHGHPSTLADEAAENPYVRQALAPGAGPSDF